MKKLTFETLLVLNCCVGQWVIFNSFWLERPINELKVKFLSNVRSTLFQSSSDGSFLNLNIPRAIFQYHRTLSTMRAHRLQCPSGKIKICRWRVKPKERQRQKSVGKEKTAVSLRRIERKKVFTRFRTNYNRGKLFPIKTFIGSGPQYFQFYAHFVDFQKFCPPL